MCVASIVAMEGVLLAVVDGGEGRKKRLFQAETSVSLRPYMQNC